MKVDKEFFGRVARPEPERVITLWRLQREEADSTVLHGGAVAKCLQSLFVALPTD